MISFDDLFAAAPVMAILRGYSRERTLELARAGWELGVRAVEVPIQSPAAVATLAELAAHARDRGAVVGAGTVLDARHVEQAADAGAGFVVSPGLDEAVVHAARDRGLAALPGVATATEVQAALRLGLRWVKAFPASVLGPDWFRAMRGPFPDVSFVATGGIDGGNAAGFLAAGADVVAVGSALGDPAALARLAPLLDR